MADDEDNIVWGTIAAAANCANIVWGTAAMDDDNIVWGTASLEDNVVWGTSGDMDNIVWGTSSDEDNITWGTSGEDTPLFDDPEAPPVKFDSSVYRQPLRTGNGPDDPGDRRGTLMEKMPFQDC